MKKYILASASPRRKELLTIMGLDFEVMPSDADESTVSPDGVPVNVYVQELALLKAGDIAKKTGRDKSKIIISADTVVYAGGKICGKPKDEEDAKKMLSDLSAKAHSVFTGVCVMRPSDGFSVCSAVETKVYFKPLSKERIESYVKTGEPMDKAGAYGIQGKGAMLVDKIDGDYFNVVGLPIARLSEILLKEFDIDVFKGE